MKRLIGVLYHSFNIYGDDINSPAKGRRHSLLRLLHPGKKLKVIGADGRRIPRFGSYLTGRKQVVNIHLMSPKVESIRPTRGV